MEIFSTAGRSAEPAGTPKVSVIVPVYNTGQYLRECLNSICAQTLRELEIICIDDGSTDRSREILEEFRSRDERIRVIFQENQGAGTARNRGIAEARGEFIAFLDSDDLLPDNAVYEDLYNAAKSQNVAVCGGSFWVFKLGEKPHPSGVPEESFPRDELRYFRDFQWDFGFTFYIFSRELITKNRFTFPPYLRYQDPPFLAKVLAKTDKIFALKRPSYCYRLNFKKVNWKFSRSRDLLLGIRDVLEFSKTHNFATLHYNQTFRLLAEYREILLELLISENKSPTPAGTQLLETLRETLKTIDFNLIQNCSPKISQKLVRTTFLAPFMDKVPPRSRVPAIFIRILAFFVLNKSVRKRWRELYLNH